MAKSIEQRRKIRQLEHQRDVEIAKKAAATKKLAVIRTQLKSERKK